MSKKKEGTTIDHAMYALAAVIKEGVISQEERAAVMAAIKMLQEGCRPMELELLEQAYDAGKKGKHKSGVDYVDATYNRKME